MWIKIAALSLFLFVSETHAQQIPVELELVLSADSSSSIRGDEFDLQIQGYANAFRDPGVVQSITDLGGNGIAVMFTQWSASFQQIETVGWTHIRSASDAAQFAASIEAQARQFTGFTTATGAAMLHAANQFGGNRYTGKRRTIDIVSDERSNEGRHPRDARNVIVSNGITINGLAVLDDGDDMLSYFRNNIIGGTGSFVMSVEAHEDFTMAIRRKLIREISNKPLSFLNPKTKIATKRLP